MRDGHVFEPTSLWVPATVGTDGSQLPTPTAQAAKHGATPDVHRNSKMGSNLWDIPHLLPTPTAQDGANNAGPSQWNRNSDPLNVVAAKLGGETMPTPSPDGSGPVDDAPPPQ